MNGRTHHKSIIQLIRDKDHSDYGKKTLFSKGVYVFSAYPISSSSHPILEYVSIPMPQPCQRPAPLPVRNAPTASRNSAAHCRRSRPSGACGVP